MASQHPGYQIAIKALALIKCFIIKQFLCHDRLRILLILKAQKSVFFNKMANAGNITHHA